MIITCPECSARYVVDPKALLPDGRVVRCAKCSHSWREDAPDVEPLPEEAQPLDIQEDDADAASPPENKADADTKSDGDAPTETAGDNVDLAISSRRKRPRPIPKGSNLPAIQGHRHGSSKWSWIGLVAFVTIIISCFLIFQDSLSAAWPASQKLYRAIGLVHEPGEEKDDAEPEIPLSERLMIKDLKPGREIRGKVSYLVVRGNVVNLTDTIQDIPPLKVALQDENRVTIREWQFKAPAGKLDPDGVISFETSLPSPPEEARDLRVSFVDDKAPSSDHSSH